MENEKLDNAIIGLDPAAPGADCTAVVEAEIIDGNRYVIAGGRTSGLRSAGIALATISTSMAKAATATGDFGRAMDFLPRAKPKKRNAARTTVTNEYSNNLRKIKKAIGARQVRKERKKFNRMLKAHNESLVHGVEVDSVTVTGGVIIDECQQIEHQRLDVRNDKQS